MLTQKRSDPITRAIILNVDEIMFDQEKIRLIREKKTQLKGRVTTNVGTYEINRIKTVDSDTLNVNRVEEVKNELPCQNSCTNANN
jgi:hypothetical protein